MFHNSRFRSGVQGLGFTVQALGFYIETQPWALNSMGLMGVTQAFCRRHGRYPREFADTLLAEKHAIALGIAKGDPMWAVTGI